MSQRLSNSNDIAWLRRRAIEEQGDIIASLGVSLREAAFRGSDATIAMTLRELIVVIKATTATVRELEQASEAPRRNG